MLWYGPVFVWSTNKNAFTVVQWSIRSSDNHSLGPSTLSLSLCLVWDKGLGLAVTELSA